MKKDLEKLYSKFNRREFVHPDPIEFLYRYNDICDREIVGLVASALAYGRVAQILKSVDDALSRMGSKPCDFLMMSTEKKLRNAFGKFKHRFTTGYDISMLLFGARALIENHGSLYSFFRNNFKAKDASIIPALTSFADKLTSYGAPSYIFPTPRMASACKRPNLFLRWMVRRDEVDPGGWEDIPASALIIPLDTHMHRIARHLGFTNRKSADLATALEVTSVFKKFRPDDPVRYDFALTRFGINKELNTKRLPIDCRLAT